MDTKKGNNHLSIIAIIIAFVTLVYTIDDIPRPIVVGIGVIGTFLYLVYLSINKSLSRDSELDNLVEENLDDDAFRNYWKEKIYIPMDITLDFDGKGERKSLFDYLRSIIKDEQPDSRYTCILGDTGSGKTDALVHFLEDYVRNYSHHSSMLPIIRLYTMNIGYKELMEQIQKDFPQNQDRRKCILLLDALDECKEAQDSLVNTPENNPSIFTQKLATETKDFAKVVVTCRKQFFMREKYFPDETSVIIGNPTGPDPFLHWQKVYIAPFSNTQVEKFLIRKFGIFGKWKSWKEARRIVHSCEDVFLRPLILSHIDTVMTVYAKRKEPLSMKDIYDAIVYDWIRREAKNKQDEIDKLLKVSVSVAGYMYKHNLAYLDEEHYNTFRKDYEIDDKDNLLRVKSLLSNGKMNNEKDEKIGYRFSHKSFYDYLLAYWFFLHPEDIGSLLGLDFTLDIYAGIYNAYKAEGDSSNIEQRLKIREVSIGMIAVGLGTLANKLQELNRFNSAEPLYQEALKYYRQLAEKNKEAFLPKVATTLNNLAILHQDTNKHQEAEKEYQEALKYYRQLAEKNKEAFLPYVATTLNNLAALHQDTNKHQEAE